MKSIKAISFTAITWAFFVPLACSEEFLEKTPAGVCSNPVLANEKGINALLIGAYASIDGAGDVDWWGGSWAWAAAVSNWVWGSVASDDATQGSEMADSSPIPYIESYTAYPDNSYVNDKWCANYDGVSRCNDVLRLIKVAGDIPEDKLSEFKAEALFLRAWFHFELKRVFDNIPYITEDVDPARVKNSTDAWPLIEKDLEYAVAHLQEEQADVGRPTRYAAMAVLARVHLFQQEWQDAADLLDEIIESDRYELMPNFDDNYLIAKRNNAESIFEIQYAVNDGTPDSFNGGYGDCLNFPQGGDIGTCCGFHQPTQNLVNAFKTDANGLPLLDTYNDENFKNDMGTKSNETFVPDTIQTLDPRLDWTVGRRGVPYLDWGIMRGSDWIRLQLWGGPYLYKKNMFMKAEQDIYSTTTGWATGVNANNYRAYRYAHVLLWRAECAVELNDLPLALGLVNKVRKRAANHVLMGRCYSYELPASANQVFDVDYTKPAANYLVKEYTGFTDQTFARKAVHMELRLEFAMEGHRFFDLVRWGEAAETLNTFIE